MSVFLVKPGTYRYDIMVKGQRYTGSGFKSEKEALIAQETRRKEVGRHLIKREILMEQQLIMSPASLKDTAFDELLIRRLNYLEQKLTKRHFEDTKLLAKRWRQEWGGKMCSQIGPNDIERFRMARAKEASNSTANKELTNLKALFNYGLRLELISRNPTRDLDHLPYDPIEKHVPTNEELDRLIAVADKNTVDFLWLLRETFARVGEVSRLLWKDIDLTKRTVTLHTYKSAKGKRTPRTIPMTEKLQEVLSSRSSRIKHDEEDYVFQRRWYNYRTKTWEQGPYKKRQRLMEDLCKKAGIHPHFGFHQIRHAGASQMAEAGAPVPAIQQILGHTTVGMTMRYVHVNSRAKVEAVRKFEAARGDSHTFHTQPCEEGGKAKKEGHADAA